MAILGMRAAIGLAVVGLLIGVLPSDAARPWPDSSERIVVFADQLAPGMSADQLAFAATRLAGTQKMTRSDIRALRERGVPPPPVVALTGYGLREDKKKALDAGFSAHLTKPVGIKELNGMFRDVLPVPVV